MESQISIINRLDALSNRLLKTITVLQAKGIAINDVLPIAAVADELEHFIKPALQYQLEQTATQAFTINLGSICKHIEINTSTNADKIQEKIESSFTEALDNSSAHRSKLVAKYSCTNRHYDDGDAPVADM